MAVTSLRDQLARLVRAELNLTRRYRCLILQANRFDVLSSLCEHLPFALSDARKASSVLAWEGFFDQVGAMAADSARARINTTGTTAAVVLAGPLHFVDYWTPGVQEGFWNFLSLYSRGPGIVVVDILRTEGVEGPFVARGVIPGTDIRFLRPRLVATEETFT
jgi:hypothetical protein